ncbi:hypothetical protein [Natrinema sp. H-ect4]
MTDWDGFFEAAAQTAEEKRESQYDGNSEVCIPVTLGEMMGRGENSE